MRNKVVAVVVFLSLLWIGTSWADVPQLINFQGRLTDSLGNPVSDGSYSIRFRFYDDSLAGNLLWEETNSVQTKSGLFTVLLGSTSAIPESSFYSPNRWLGIKVGASSEITPRQRLASVGYSFQSGQWSSTGNDIFRDSGNVGIGTTPGFLAKLDVLSSGSNSFIPIKGVQGIATNTSSGNAYGGYFSGSSSGGSGYGVYSTGSTRGVYGSGALAGGDFVGTDGGSAGITAQGVVAGVTGNGGAYGIYGTSSSGTGVYGASTNSYGVYAASTNGYGVYATGGPNGVVASASSGAGVSAASANGPGVVASGFTNGVEATGGTRGVYATGSNYGVVGGGLYGVYGVATQGFQGYGVYGSAGGISGTWAGAFDRDVYIAGFLAVDGLIYKNGGGFRIDHPLDPANKYLYHSFVESPDMMNIYNGNVVTDANGNATVTLPDWFGALNKDFRYQLTVIGQFAQAIISQEITNNRFSIQTDKPNVKVSWQVTGIRQDAYANTHRITVEVEKTGNERGKYLQPEAHGAPASLGMHYEEMQKLTAEHKKMEEQRIKMEQQGSSPNK